MKKLIQFFITILTLLMLFSLQLCLLKYEHTVQINLLLIAYTYSLFTKLNFIIPASLIVLLDAINFIITGYFGFTTICMAIVSIICLKIQADFYNKLILPLSLTTLYSLTQAIIFFYIFNDSAILTNFILATLLNNLILITIWIINKEPIHD